MTGQEDHDPHEAQRPGSPARRPGDAREIAALIAFVCSRGGGASSPASRSSWTEGCSLMAAQQDRQAP